MSGSDGIGITVFSSETGPRTLSRTLSYTPQQSPSPDKRTYKSKLELWSGGQVSPSLSVDHQITAILKNEMTTNLFSYGTDRPFCRRFDYRLRHEYPMIEPAILPEGNDFPESEHPREFRETVSLNGSSFGSNQHEVERRSSITRRAQYAEINKKNSAGLGGGGEGNRVVMHQHLTSVDSAIEPLDEILRAEERHYESMEELTMEEEVRDRKKSTKIPEEHSDSEVQEQEILPEPQDDQDVQCGITMPYTKTSDDPDQERHNEFVNEMRRSMALQDQLVLMQMEKVYLDNPPEKFQPFVPKEDKFGLPLPEWKIRHAAKRLADDAVAAEEKRLWSESEKTRQEIADVLQLI